MLPIGWMWLERKNGWCAWEVVQLWVFPEYRGNGIATQFYKTAIDNLELMLASGISHTRHSKKLWKRFIQEETFNIWAHDFKNLERYSSIEVDEDGELSCDLAVYIPFSKYKMGKEDVRLVAIKKEKTS